MAEVSINEFMTRLPLAFQPEKATGLDVTLQFILTGAETGEWYAVIKDSKCSVTQGTTPSPKLTVTMDSSDLMKLLTGQLDGMQAFMLGKIRLAGDMNLAMKMINLFKPKS